MYQKNSIYQQKIINTLWLENLRKLVPFFFNCLIMKEERKNNNLNPYWVTGFTDAEGCFYTRIAENKSKWRVQVCFQIGLHIKDIDLLIRIRSFFNDVGNIYIRNNGKSANYQVRTVSSIVNIIIPHFEKYTLISQKYSDFILWKEIVNLMDDKEHLTKEGLKKVINLKASLNHGLSDKLITSFPKIEKTKRIQPSIPDIIDSHWIAGFISGEGCFFINISKSKDSKLNYSVKLRLSIVQHSRDEQLMNIIANTLQCGTVYKHYKNTVVLIIFDFEKINNLIIPLFKKYNIEGIKSMDFKDFCKAAELINQKVHLTQNGLEEIQKIKTGMNKNRLEILI